MRKAVPIRARDFARPILFLLPIVLAGNWESDADSGCLAFTVAAARKLP